MFMCRSTTIQVPILGERNAPHLPGWRPKQSIQPRQGRPVLPRRQLHQCLQLLSIPCHIAAEGVHIVALRCAACQEQHPEGTDGVPAVEFGGWVLEARIWCVELLNDGLVVLQRHERMCARFNSARCC